MEITPEIQALLDEQMAKITADFKLKLDKAYEERDNANASAKKAADDLAAGKRSHDLDVLKAREEGRTTGEKKLNAALERIDALEAHNTALAKDKAVNSALTGFTFRTSSAQQIARDLVSGNLVQNDKGEWVVSDGRSPESYVKETLESDEYSFLLKPAVSSGGGTGRNQGGGGENEPASLLEKSNEQLLKRYMK